MANHTHVAAEAGKQEVLITREFDLPVALLFKAYVEPDLVAQWMGTKVLKLENKRHGSWHFETTDAKGNTYGFSGVIHEFSPNQKITRTFEMDRLPGEVQLEFLAFEALTADTSRLQMHTVYKSPAHRDQVLQMGMEQGINMAHNRLQTMAGNLK